jgi:hypothetical protein
MQCLSPTTRENDSFKTRNRQWGASGRPDGPKANEAGVPGARAAGRYKAWITPGEFFLLLEDARAPVCKFVQGPGRVECSTELLLRFRALVTRSSCSSAHNRSTLWAQTRSSTAPDFSLQPNPSLSSLLVLLGRLLPSSGLSSLFPAAY